MQKLRESRLQLIVKFFLRAACNHISLGVRFVVVLFSVEGNCWDIFQALLFSRLQYLGMIGPKID